MIQMTPDEQARVTTRDLAAHIDDLTRAVNQNTTVTSALRERVDRALTDVSDHETRLRTQEQHASTVDTRVTVISDRIDAVNDRVDSVDHRITGIVSTTRWILGGAGVLILAVLAVILPHLRWG